MPPPEGSGAVPGAAGNACRVWLRGKEGLREGGRAGPPRAGPRAVKEVTKKDQVEASLWCTSPQLELEKEKLGAMQAHLAGKMALSKAPAMVSTPSPKAEDFNWWGPLRTK